MGEGSLRSPLARDPDRTRGRSAPRNAPSRRWTRSSRRQRDEEEKRLGAETHARQVGAFEGANYEAKGYYRPAVDCIMFTRDRVPFCPVCRHGIDRVIDLYAK